MLPDNEELYRVLAEMATIIEHNNNPEPQLCVLFFQKPELGFDVLDIMQNLNEEPIEAESPIYSACMFALDICMAQLQAAKDANFKGSAKTLTQFMDKLAALLCSNKHSLGFWLPLLNAFYEIHADLTENLQDAYFELANNEDLGLEEGDVDAHISSIKELLQELASLSVFDITEHFFAQSYAMPADFFSDLVTDLYSIEEGQEIALLTLLHPKEEVREVVMATLEHLMPSLTLSPIALSRLETIKQWYPEASQELFNKWIKMQRMKGVVFAKESDQPFGKIEIQSTEVDGSGSQGLFIHMKNRKKNRIGGLLLKYDVGIKDSWLTPILTAAEVVEYQQQAFDESMTLRPVDLEYFQYMVAHFLALTLERGDVPYLHFLEIKEILGLRIKPQKLPVATLMEELGVQIVPFTQEVIDKALKRTKSWIKNKHFVDSWYTESALVDKIVNTYSNFINGTKVCRLEEAMAKVFEEEFEPKRQRWLFHFLWVALWFKSKAKKTEKMWQDSFLIAHAIQQGYPLKDIPLMKEICAETVMNSVETMQERKTYLS